MEKERIFLAVDAECCWCSARDKFGKDARLDFQKLKGKAEERKDSEIVLAKAYVVTNKLSTVSSFVSSLNHMGYEVELGYSYQTDGSKMDVAIAVDAIKFLRRYDTYVLASGDGDFVALVLYLKEKGKKVEIVSTKEDISAKLLKNADEVYFIREDMIYREEETKKDEVQKV